MHEKIDKLIYLFNSPYFFVTWHSDAQKGNQPIRIDLDIQMGFQYFQVLTLVFSWQGE